ncbi:(S)-sulfolactate dehydrogenase [Rhodobacteraceae bacterium IMCC1933]|jgi:(S)-sulfolactate dehydrogenase|nr:(S)-sulfolactate dehydrogenase [Rhodobacteraceae bacterium IMCC1923]MDP4068286.1 (S)-sulfolactate dehydrogenase [Rhodobacteraceae bacterium IMCC1933]MDP4071552.1 (S)-sulfolactate dehydrogenase [Rhodobacteraceae bacterium IMCC1909]
MADVLISEFMDRGVAEGLISEFDTYWDPDLWGKRDELKSRIASAKAIVVRNGTLVDVDLLDAAPNLKVVARMGVGLDTIDVAACKARGIEVCPSIGANAVSVAEYVIASAMILLRGPTYFATPDVAAGAWDRPKFAGSTEIAGRVMGIVGFGSIGQVVGDKARGMGMEVIAYDAMMSDDHPAWADARRVDLDALVAEADVISLHCPKLPETIDLIDKRQFERMKPEAVLVNSARGGIVNEKDCAEALRSAQLAGAALDTLDVEPITAEVGAMFQGIENLILTPHVAGVTKESNRRIAEVAAQNVRRVLG